MKELTLYEISGEISSILSAEEWTDETVSALESAQTSMTEKVGSIAEIIRQAESQAEMCRAEEQRIAAMRTAREKKAEWLRGYLLSAMQQAQLDEISIGTRKVAIQQNPPAVSVLDESAIPPRFFVIVPESKKLDKKALAAELKGRDVPGAELTRSKRLVIK